MLPQCCSVQTSCSLPARVAMEADCQLATFFLELTDIKILLHRV